MVVLWILISHRSCTSTQAIRRWGQATIDDLVEINLGTDLDPRPTYSSALLSLEENEQYQEFLQEHQDCFVWSYKEMPILDPGVAVS